MSTSSDDFEFSSYSNRRLPGKGRPEEESVEDVLAKIRELVTEEAALKTQAATASLSERLAAVPRDTSRPELHNPLILTPEFRVVPPVLKDRIVEERPNPVTEASDSHGPAVDDAQLRALVTEIVRKELSGALGATLTGNIRKMIRRELAQMIRVKE